MSELNWFPHVAVSRYSLCDREYSFPVASVNSHDGQVQISSDSIQFGFSVYEGMRAYLAGTEYFIFRAADHHRRLVSSCAALELPCPSYEVFIEAIKLVVERNVGDGVTNLYIRPVVFAASGGIMPQQGGAYRFVVLCTEFNPVCENVKVLIDDQNLRTVPAFSTVKTASNYSSSFLLTRKAVTEGFDTVLWLDRGGYVQECSTMNIFFCIKGQLVTPSLESILPGVTRRTVIELLGEQNTSVSEQQIHIEELAGHLRSGDVQYAFITSTALGVNNIASFTFAGNTYKTEKGGSREVAAIAARYVNVTKGFSAELALPKNILEQSYLGFF